MSTSSHGLRRELKLIDLVTMQVVLVFGMSWAGFAAKQGPSQLVLWLMAIALFYLPLAGVVMNLSRTLPFEGGVYQWARAGLSPFAGFLSAWCVAVYCVVVFGAIGSGLANGFAWALGPSWGWIGTDRWVAFGLTLAFCVVSWWINVRGLSLLKWLGDSSAILWGLLALIMLGLLVKAVTTGHWATPGAFSWTWPALSVATVGVFAKMALGALSGLDNCAVFSEECRRPENDVGRSVTIAAPAIALAYVLSTAALLAFTPPEQIDLAAPIQQGVRAGLGAGPVGQAITFGIVVVYAYANVASGVIMVGMAGRLPMVAGWDGLLPSWWSDLHPKWRTPSKALAAVSGAMAAMSLVSLVGAGNDEAVQTLSAVGTAALAVMYLLLFSVMLFGSRRLPKQPGPWLRFGAGTGFVVALVSLLFQLVPVGEVADRGRYSLKVGALFAVAFLAGSAVYWRGSRRLSRVTPPG